MHPVCIGILLIEINFVQVLCVARRIRRLRQEAVTFYSIHGVDTVKQ